MVKKFVNMDYTSYPNCDPIILMQMYDLINETFRSIVITFVYS